MPVIRGVPHLDFYIAEPQFAVLSYGHRLVDLANKMNANSTLATSDDLYQFSYTEVQGVARPNLRYLEFADVFVFNVQAAPEDNGFVGTTNIEWLVDDTDRWLQTIPQGQTTSFIHFVDGSADAVGQCQLDNNVVANCPFIIPLQRYGLPDNADPTATAPTVEITFGGKWKLVLYNNGQVPELQRFNDTPDGGRWIPVSYGPAGMFGINQMDYVTIQIIDRWLCISNGLQTSSDNIWRYYDPAPETALSVYSPSRPEPVQKPIITRSAPVFVEVKNQMAVLALWLMVHDTEATIRSPKYLTDQYYRLLPMGLDDARAECQFRVPYGVDADVTIALSAFGNFGLYYDITITSEDVRFTPFLYEAQVHIPRNKAPIIRSPARLVNLPSERIESVQLNSTCEDQSGSIIVNNFGGTYRNVTGVHGCAIDMAWHYVDEATLRPYAIPRAYGNELFRKFTGFFQKSTRDRSSPSESKMTLPLVSRRVMVEDAIAVNLPIFDGCCELYAFLEILYRAGLEDHPSDPVGVYNSTTGGSTTVFTTPGILAWQNPWNGTYQTLRQYWSSFGFDPGADRECRLGLCNHPILPSSAWNSPPKLKFEMGTSLWDCAMEIRKHSFPWIYFNNWGNCVIFHAFRADLRRIMGNWFQQPLGTFREIPASTPFDLLGYNEFHSLGVDLDTSYIRNAVMAIGLDEDQLIPLMAMYKNDLRNGDAFNYIPWFKWHLARSPFWNTSAHVNNVALNLFLRARRPRPETSLTGWGQPAMFPYTLVELLEGTPEVGSSRECFPDELYNTSRIFRAVSVNESMNFVDKSYRMSLTAEWQDALSIQYFDPVF
jgi:hypothetical protein